MRVVFYSAGESLADWEQAFRTHLPDIRLEDWSTAPPGADYAIAWKPPASLFERQPGLKAMFALGAGVDALLPHCPDSLPLYRLEDSGMAWQMADYVTRMLLDWFYQDGRYRQQQQDAHWLPHALDDKAKWPIAILGLGKLGSTVAERCRLLGFPVAGWRQHPTPSGEMQVFTGKDGLASLIRQSRVIVNLLPLTPQTRDLLNAELFGHLPDGGYLINIARGAQLVEEDLLTALASGKLSGAALDVFREEPLAASHPFWKHPAIRITPHVAGITPMQDAVTQISNKLLLLAAGQQPSGLVDRVKGY